MASVLVIRSFMVSFRDNNELTESLLLESLERRRWRILSPNDSILEMDSENNSFAFSNLPNSVLVLVSMEFCFSSSEFLHMLQMNGVLAVRGYRRC